MRRTSTLVLWLLVVLSGALLTGCGKGKATDAAKAMRGLTSKLSNGGSSGSAPMLSMRNAREETRAQAWLLKFESEAGIEHEGTVRVLSTTTDADLGCTATGCTADSAGNVAACTIACTGAADDAFSCKSTNYTVHKGSAVSLAFNNSGQVYNFTFDMSAKISGGEFSNTEVICHAVFSVNLANPNDAALDCNNAANKCTVAGEAIGCSQLNEEMDSEDNAC